MNQIVKRLISLSFLLFTLPVFAEDAISGLRQLCLDSDLYGLSLIYDPAWTGPVLRWTGAL